MTKICEEFGIEYGVQYNPTKTVCILYARKAPKENPKISLNGTELKLVDTVKHLGNYLDANMRDHTDVRRNDNDNDNDNDNIVYLTKNNNTKKDIQYFGLTNDSLIWRLLLRQNILSLS